MTGTDQPSPLTPLPLAEEGKSPGSGSSAPGPAWSRRITHTCILAILFLAGWWWRPLPYDVKRALPYFAGFGVAIPALIAVAAWLLSGMPGLRDTRRDVRRVFLAGLLLLAAWILISPAWARYQAQSMTAALQFAVVALAALVALCDGPRPRLLVAALALGLAVQSTVVLFQFRLQRPIGLYDLGEVAVYPDDTGVSVVSAGLLRLMRPYGLTVHPNVAGGALATALAALGGGLVRRKSPAWRWLMLAIVGLCGFWALLATFSRGAWLAYAAGIAVFFLFALRRRADRPSWSRAALMLGTMLIVAGLFTAAYPDLVLARVGGESEDVELISLGTRQIFYDFAGQIIARKPVAGTGIGTFPWEARDLLIRTPLRTLVRAENVHSVPLLALSETGVVGLTLWLAAVGAALAAAWRRARTPHAAALAAAAVVLLAAGLLDHYPWTMLPMSLLGWILLASAARGD